MRKLYYYYNLRENKKSAITFKKLSKNIIALYEFSHDLENDKSLIQFNYQSWHLKTKSKIFEDCIEYSLLNIYLLCISIMD